MSKIYLLREIQLRNVHSFKRIIYITHQRNHVDREGNSLAVWTGNATLSQVLCHTLDRHLHVVVCLPLRKLRARNALVSSLPLVHE